MNGQTGRQVDRKTAERTDAQSDKWMDKQVDRKSVEKTGAQTDK